MFISDFKCVFRNFLVASNLELFHWCVSNPPTPISHSSHTHDPPSIRKSKVPFPMGGGVYYVWGGQPQTNSAVPTVIVIALQIKKLFTGRFENCFTSTNCVAVLERGKVLHWKRLFVDRRLVTVIFWFSMTREVCNCPKYFQSRIFCKNNLSSLRQNIDSQNRRKIACINFAIDFGFQNRQQIVNSSNKTCIVEKFFETTRNICSKCNANTILVGTAELDCTPTPHIVQPHPPLEKGPFDFLILGGSCVCDECEMGVGGLLTHQWKSSRLLERRGFRKTHLKSDINIWCFVD